MRGQDTPVPAPHEAAGAGGLSSDTKGPLCESDPWRKAEMTGTRAPISERLNRRLVRMPNGCLEWSGFRHRGYGKIGVGNKMAQTHRVAWELANGPIPPGMKILHHCDNPPCCETEPSDAYPEGHLFLGTLADNSQDMASKGRHYNQQKPRCLQGHPYDEANTRMWRGLRKCRECLRLYANKSRLIKRSKVRVDE